MKKLALFTCLLALTVAPALADTNVTFPDADKTYLKDIPRFDTNTFVHITKGMHSDGVRKLLGNPHFNEFISNEWNYIVKIRKPNTQTYTQCQLQIHFDNQYISDYHWNTPECSTLIGSAIQSSQPMDPIVVAQESAGTPQRFHLSTDVLFNFDSSELKQEGHKAINELIRTVDNKIKLL